MGRSNWIVNVVITLPVGIRDNGNPLSDKIAEREQSRLDRADHGAHQDEAHVKISGYPRYDVGLQVEALLLP